MQTKFKPRQDKINQLQNEIAALAQQLQSSSGKLTPQAEADLTAQGQRKQRDLQRMQDDLQAEATAYRNDVLTQSSAKMNGVVKKLAEEKGLDLIVDTSTTLYFKPALDLTNDAIAAYDKAYPANVPGSNLSRWPGISSNTARTRSGARSRTDSEAHRVTLLVLLIAAGILTFVFHNYAPGAPGQAIF